jgi:uncharacterized membrane protein
MLLTDNNNQLVDDLRRAQACAFWGAVLLLISAGYVLLYIAAERLVAAIPSC